MSNSRDIKTD
jgi:hypothetical protein